MASPLLCCCLCFIRYSSADTHVVFYTVNPVLLFSFSAMMGTVWKLILMTLASTTREGLQPATALNSRERKRKTLVRDEDALSCGSAFLEIRRYIKDKNSWKWLAAQKRFAGLAKINESECRNSSTASCTASSVPPVVATAVATKLKKTKERPTKIRKD